MKTSPSILVLLTILLTASACSTTDPVIVTIDTTTVLSDVSHHPIGINIDYLMDDDNFLKPKTRTTAEALKAMGVKYLRYPGGNKSDFYFFSTPPYEKSRPTLARTGKEAVGGSRAKMLNDDYATFKYDVLDFDEFIQLCRQIDAVPIICVAADEYLVDYPPNCTISSREQLIKHAAEWVRYANIKKKYNVEYWMIGNETWHQQNINSTPEIYARDVVDFSKAMKAVDPTIKIVPNGRNEDWWQIVLPVTADHIDAVCVSNYPVYNYENGYADYRDNYPDLTKQTDIAIASIEKFLPSERAKQVKVIIAEYGSMDWAGKWPHINNQGHNLASFEMTGLFLNNPRVHSSQFWNTRWIHNKEKEDSIFDALDKDNNFNANAYGLAIFGNHLAKYMVETSSTLHVRTFASYDPEPGRLFLYLINKAPGQRTISLDIKGRTIHSVLQRWELIAIGPEDTNPIYQQNPCIPQPDDPQLTLPHTSITLLELKLK